MRPPQRSRSRGRMAWPSMVVPGPGSEALGARRDLVLELHQAVDDALGARRAAGNIDVHRDDGVDPLDRRVVVVKAPRAVASAKSDHPLRLQNWVVGLLLHRRHLVT